MAHTFDIRFARSSGLAASFQAPTNTFGWKGAGRLSIDPEGISIAVRRGANSLFPQIRRVPAADLKGVLREGDALRLEFATDSNTRAVVPFWVRDQETAEEIVRLLPTTRTVELDHDAAGVAYAQGRIDWRALTLFVVALVSIAGGLWMLLRSHAPAAVAQTDARTAILDSTVSAAPSAEDVPEGSSSKPSAIAGPLDGPGGDTQDASGDDYPVALAQPDLDAPTRAQHSAATPADAHPSASTMDNPTVEGEMPRYPFRTAQQELALFESETAQLIDETRSGVSSSQSLDARWWAYTVRLYNDRGDSNLRDLQLAVSRAWRDYIYLRAEGHPGAEFALEFAERLTARVPEYAR